MPSTRQPTKPEWFTVTSVYIRPDLERVVHCYGTYPNRRAAINAKNRMKTELKKNFELEIADGTYDLNGLTYHVCQIFEDN